MPDDTPVLSPATDPERRVRRSLEPHPLLSGGRAIVVVAQSSIESVAARIEGNDAGTDDPVDPAERAAAEGARLARAAGLDADGFVARGTGSVG